VKSQALFRDRGFLAMEWSTDLSHSILTQTLFKPYSNGTPLRCAPAGGSKELDFLFFPPHGFTVGLPYDTPPAFRSFLGFVFGFAFDFRGSC